MNQGAKTGSTDLEQIGTLLNSMQYEVFSKVLGAQHYGAAQHRDRIYIVAMLTQHTPKQFGDGSVQPEWVGKLDFLLERMKVTPTSLQDHLLDDDDPRIKAWQQSRLESKAKNSKSARGDKYQVDHLEASLLCFFLRQVG